MSKNTLFNYFTRSPASTTPKTNGSSLNNEISKTPKRPAKDTSVTPKRTPNSVNRSSKKVEVSNGSAKKTTEKRKPIQLGNIIS